MSRPELTGQMLDESSENRASHAVHSRVLHRGRIFTLVEDTVTFPDGSTGTMDVVRHPGASAVLPILGSPGDPNPVVVLVHQYRYAGGGWLLEIPAGRLGQEEAPAACARRELTEETGYTAGGITPLGTILTTPGFSDEIIHLFLAYDLSPGQRQLEADEFIELVRLPLSEVKRQVRTGEIRDAKSIAAILLACEFRGSR